MRRAKYHKAYTVNPHSRARLARPDLPHSGDRMVDWVFMQFVTFLRRETLRIRRKKRLVDPDDPHRVCLRGLMDPDTDKRARIIHILINAARSVHRDRDEEVGTLIHELSHIVFWKTGERFIVQMENMLIRKFSSAQRRYLKAFLPRHEIKNYPRPTERSFATA